MTQSFEEAKRAVAPCCGVGLGLRWDFLEELAEQPPVDLACLEISPENYMGRGGYFPHRLEQLADHYSFLTHGLTMSVGAAKAPPTDYLQGVQAEQARVNSPVHSDHLCLATLGDAVAHELLPLPLTLRSLGHSVDSIGHIQDRLGCPFLVENIAYYAHISAPEMPEVTWLGEVLQKSGAGLLLDVNNVYVNAINHGFDPFDFIAQLPLEQVVAMHVAGHTSPPPGHPAHGLLLDNHGEPVIDPVKSLLAFALRRTGPVPVILERDHNLPHLSELLHEVASLQAIYDAAISH